MQKIDKNLLFCISALSKSETKVECIVFLKQGVCSKLMLKRIVGEDSIIAFYPFLNACSIQIEKKFLPKLAGLNFVEYVSSIQKASILLNNSRKILKIDEIHKRGITGKGVTVAIIDTGCHPHLDFCLGHNRIKAFYDFMNENQNPYDDNGHGTFVCGVVGGNGLTYNGKYRGVAPNAELVVIKALDKNGETTANIILSAMQWILDSKDKLNIQVVCMSFGSQPIENSDPLAEGAKVLWENGICVVCAGGNDGPGEGSIKSPGSCPNVITVGSVDKIDEEKNLKVAPFSSRGPAFDYIKPDIMAPGVDIISTSTSDAFYSSMSGTSVSTPFVAGICALMLQNDETLSPNEIKEILMKNASKFENNPNASGSGFLNLENIFF